MSRRFVLLCLLGALMLMGAREAGPKKAAKVRPVADNRLYSGAPPVIAHKVAEIGRGECLGCHLEGNALDKSGLKPKKTPHPELDRCVQCHVEDNSRTLFKENRFVGHTYATGIRSQPYGPWLIPHPLTMRENCLGCHGEVDAPDHLKTDHPERRRCVQCHLPAHAGFPGPRPDLEPSRDPGGGLDNWSL